MFPCRCQSLPETNAQVAELAGFLVANVSLLEGLLLRLRQQEPALIGELWQQKCRGNVPYGHSIAPRNVINNGFGGV